MEKAVLITGAGQRIGFYLAEQFLQQTAYPVLFTYRTFRPEVQALQDLGAVGIQVDFNQPQAMSKLEAALQSVQSLRGVIHNASIWETDAEVAAHPELWEQLFTVHAKVPYEVNQLCEPWLLRAVEQGERADIVHITDCKAKRGAADYAAYLASKAALSSLTQSFAKRFAPNIKVNEIAPGLILFNEEDDEIYRQDRLAKNAIPIEPGPEVIWQTVDYLFKNIYATGTVIELGQLVKNE